MSKKTIRIIAFVVLIVMLLSTSAVAAESRASAYFSSYFAAVTAEGSGEIAVSFYVNATRSMTKLGATIIRIYNTNGTLMTTIFHPNTPNLVVTNESTHAGYVTYYGTSGQSYYATVLFYAENSSGSETRTYTTSAQKA